MAEEAGAATATEVEKKEFDAAIKDLGDKIVGLSLIQARDLADYLKQEYDIEPAAGGGAVMMAAGPAEAAPAEEEKTEFDVVIKAAGDKKLQVIKAVRAIRSDLGLKEAKELVDNAPKTLVEGASKEDAEKFKTQLEEAGATVELA